MNLIENCNFLNLSNNGKGGALFFDNLSIPIIISMCSFFNCYSLNDECGGFYTVFYTS